MGLMTDNWDGYSELGGGAFPLEGEEQKTWLKGKEPYTSGFHVFATKKEAERAKSLLNDFGARIVKVKVRGITCEGIDGTDRTKEYLNPGLKTLVAKEIFIPKSEE